MNTSVPPLIIPPLIDNETFALRDAVKEFAKYSTEVKIATGYLRLSGFNLIKDDLSKLRPPTVVNGKIDSPMKIIMGREVDVPTAEQLIEGYRKRITEDIAKLDLEKLSELYEFIQTGILDVHLQPDKRFHAKAYLFRKMSGYFRPDITIIGSSNFTYEGQAESTELNEVDFNGSTVVPLEQWFDKHWQASSEFREDLLKIIESDHRFPVLAKTKLPYVYLSPADWFKHLILSQGKEYLVSGEEEKILLQFQIADYKQCLTIIKDYGGAINATGVGLGKSYVACQTMKHYLAQGKRILLIAPPHLLVPEQWIGYLREFGISPHEITLLSMYEFSNEDFDDAKCLDYDLIVVDEVHNFRNSESNRYRSLRKIRSKNTEYLLLSATPINNSPEDLKSIIDIFLDETRFGSSRKELLEPYYALGKYIKASSKFRREGRIDKGLLKELQDSIRELRKHLIVRTTRKDLRNSYGETMKLEGRTVKFYEPKLVPLEYTLSGPEYKELFDGIVDFLADLELTHLTFLNPDSAQPLTAIYKHLLYKRLESSIDAFNVSIENLKRSQKQFLRLLQTSTLKQIREKPPDELRSELRHIEIEDQPLADFIEWNAVEKNPSEAEKQRYIKSVENDIKITEAFYKIIEKIKKGSSFQDDKLDLLKAELTKDPRKKVLFTQFIDTANYLHDNLQTDESLGRIYLVTGDVKEKTSRIEAFRKDNKSKLMVSTDVLSEGVNIPEPDVVINYDLPWNPVRMIQRVGRVDRLGVNKQIDVWNFNPDKKIDKEIHLVRRLKSKIDDIILIIGIEYAILSPEEIELIRNKELGDIELFEDKRKQIIGAKWDELEGQGEARELDELDQLLLTAIGKFGITLDSLKTPPTISPNKIPYTRLRADKKGVYFFEELTIGKPPESLKQYERIAYPNDEHTPKLSDIRLEEKSGRLTVEETMVVDGFKRESENIKQRLITERQTNLGAQHDLQGVKDSIETKISNVIRTKTLTSQGKQRAEKVRELFTEFTSRDIPSSYLRRLQTFRKEWLSDDKRVLTNPFVEAFDALVTELKRTSQLIARPEETTLETQAFLSLVKE